MDWPPTDDPTSFDSLRTISLDGPLKMLVGVSIRMPFSWWQFLNLRHGHYPALG